jgi:hypothetical protein
MGSGTRARLLSEPMNVVPDIDSTDARLELRGLFLRRTRAEVEQMRRSVPKLIEGDDQTWNELKANATRISSMAAGLELTALSSRSQELCRLADERPERGGTDTQFLLSLTRTIELVAFELNQLFVNQPRR